MAARAVCGNRFLILVRPMTVQTRGRSVNGHGGEIALSGSVATRAVLGAVRFEGATVARLVPAILTRESVAVDAVRVHARAEALLR